MTSPKPTPPLDLLPSDAEEYADALLGVLRAAANPENVEGMRRYGISTVDTLGVSMPNLRDLARQSTAQYRRDDAARHRIADRLWDSGVHEARILAALIDVPALVDETQMERWAHGLDSWDVCDQLCGSLFDKSAFAWQKAAEWAGREPEFVKRAGFVLMTQLAVHDKSAAERALRGVLAAHRSRSRGRAPVREEGGELGTASDRQAERATQRPSDRGRRGDPCSVSRLPRRALGRA